MSNPFRTTPTSNTASLVTPAAASAVNAVPTGAWPFLSTTDQSVAKTSSPTFINVNANKLNIKNNGYTAELSTVLNTLTADRRIIIPNRDVDLDWVPDQNVKTTSEPRFSRLRTTFGLDTHWLLLSTSSVNLWGVGIDYTTQAFKVERYSDAGVLQDTPFRIKRSNGYCGLCLSADPTEALHVGGNIQCDGFLTTNSGALIKGGIIVNNGLTVQNTTLDGACSLALPTTKANVTLTLPYTNKDLKYLPSQFVDTTSSPQFTKLGVGQAAGTEALEVNGNIKCSKMVYPVKVAAPDSSVSPTTILDLKSESGYGIYVDGISIANHGGSLQFKSYDYNNNAPTTRLLMTLDPTGCIGIGKAAGTRPLEVGGGFKASGIVTTSLTSPSLANGATYAFDGNTLGVTNAMLTISIIRSGNANDYACGNAFCAVGSVMYVNKLSGGLGLTQSGSTVLLTNNTGTTDTFIIRAVCVGA